MEANSDQSHQQETRQGLEAAKPRSGEQNQEAATLFKVIINTRIARIR